MKEIKAKDGYYLSDPNKENFFKAVKGENINEEDFIEVPEASAEYIMEQRALNNGEELTYKQQVVALIRERYDRDDESALTRQRDTKPEEFEEYFAYCEECKKQVKQKLGML